MNKCFIRRRHVAYATKMATFSVTEMRKYRKNALAKMGLKRCDCYKSQNKKNGPAPDCLPKIG